MKVRAKLDGRGSELRVQSNLGKIDDIRGVATAFIYNLSYQDTLVIDHYGTGDFPTEFLAVYFLHTATPCWVGYAYTFLR